MTENKKYFIDYGTGAGNEYADTLEEAKRIADEGACYTQRSITIFDTTTGEFVTGRRWCGLAYSPDDYSDDDCYVSKNPIIFGKWGYYNDWSDEIYF